MNLCAKYCLECIGKFTSTQNSYDDSSVKKREHIYQRIKYSINESYESSIHMMIARSIRENTSIKESSIPLSGQEKIASLSLPTNKITLTREHSLLEPTPRDSICKTLVLHLQLSIACSLFFLCFG